MARPAISGWDLRNSQRMYAISYATFSSEAHMEGRVKCRSALKAGPKQLSTTSSIAQQWHHRSYFSTTDFT